MELKINTEYENLLPKLTVEQFEALKKSIQEEGQHYPIAYNKNFEILDGHNRFKICKALNINPLLETEPRVFLNLLDERQFVLETNLLRRHLPDFARIIAAKPLLMIYREKANQRQKELGKTHGVPLSQNFAEGGEDEIKGKAIEQFAKTVQSNPETVRQALYVEEHATPERIEAVKSGNKSISRAYNETRQEQIPKAETPPLPEGKYRTIIIDPPWATEKILRDVRPNQVEWEYPSMSLEEISKLPIQNLAYEDGCHIYLWVTHKYLPEAFKLFEQWGVKYECLLTWVKNVGFTPFSWMYNTEHVLFGRIGSLKLTKLGTKLSFEAPVTVHSEKPDVFFNIVTEASPDPRLEMFARKTHNGFKPWGNEVATVAER